MEVVHIDIIMDKMFEALYIKYNHEAPIHSLKIVILARLNVKMYSQAANSSHRHLDSCVYPFVCVCVWVQITPSNPNIFNIILLFVGFAQKHKTHTQLHAYIVVVLPMPWMSMPNRHGIERKMSSFKLSYNGIVYDNAFFGSASQCLCIYTILYSLLCFMHLLTTQTMA